MKVLQTKPNFFSENSPFLSHPLLTGERTAAEVDFVVDVLSLGPGKRILDVGCGFGRHSIALAERGIKVVGVDSAPAMIEAARKRAGDRFPASQLKFLCEAAETFTAVEPFDAAIALLTTLGQVGETGENSGLVRQVYEALVPGGLFLVEVPQRGPAVADMKTAERFGSEENYTKIKREYNSHSHYMTEHFEIKKGEIRNQFLLQYRLYSRQELVGLLETNGFHMTGFYGGYDGQPLTDKSGMMLMRAAKWTG